MNPIRCMFIDDEPPAIELLHKYASMIDQLEVVAASNSAIKAFEQLKKIQVDLIFLDIRMPVLNGLDFVKTLQHPPSIIITTAYREYALDGYDLDIIDYLLKPIAFDRFLKAIDRYHERSTLSPTSAASHSTKKENKDYIFFNVNKTHHKVMIEDIIYIESLKDYVRIHTKTDKLVVKGNLGSAMKLLPSSDIIRIHRSYAIATQYVKSFNQAELVVGGQRLPIGISYRDTVTKTLKG